MNFIENQQAYFNNSTRDYVPPNPADVAMQQVWSKRQFEKEQKKRDLLNPVLNNNKCNIDLGNRVETGAFQFFECPPMLFSPTAKDPDELGGQTISQSNSQESVSV